MAPRCDVLCYGNQSVLFLSWLPAVPVTCKLYCTRWICSIGLGTGTDNRTGIFTGISPQNRYFTPVYRSTQCCSDLLSLSLLISMATVKSLTSTPGLEGSLLRCQGHIGRSDRQRLRVLSVFLFLKPKCLHILALPLSFLTIINSFSSHAAIFVQERDRDREFWPLSGFRYTGTLRLVPAYRTEATRIGALGITAAYRQPYCSTTVRAATLKQKLIKLLVAPGHSTQTLGQPVLELIIIII